MFDEDRNKINIDSSSFLFLLYKIKDEVEKLILYIEELQEKEKERVNK